MNFIGRPTSRHEMIEIKVIHDEHITDSSSWPNKCSLHRIIVNLRDDLTFYFALCLKVTLVWHKRLDSRISQCECVLHILNQYLF